MPSYFITPNYSVGLIPKVGCSSFGCAVIKAFQPDELQRLENAFYPSGLSFEKVQSQVFAKRERQPSKQTLVFVRNPLQRFLSAMAQVNISDIDEAIDSLNNGTRIVNNGQNERILCVKTNVHFLPQILWCLPDTKLYKFPDHIQDGAQEIGLEYPLPVINEASRPKPVPSQSQESAINQYYSEDWALYNSITYPGIITGAVSVNHTWPEGSERPRIVGLGN
jgi:hypothetical protein